MKTDILEIQVILKGYIINGDRADNHGLTVSVPLNVTLVKHLDVVIIHKDTFTAIRCETLPIPERQHSRQNL